MERAADNQELYYCMVNCHSLGYDMCTFIDEMVKLKLEENPSYRIGLLYHSEDESAEIRSLLQKYTVKSPSQSSNQALEEYISRILLVPEQDVEKSAAAVADPDRYEGFFMLPNLFIYFENHSSVDLVYVTS